MALDPSTGIVVLSYGGLGYPRYGLAIMWSHDHGVSWSNEMVLHQEFSTGYSSLLRVKPGRFVLLSDHTPTQVGCGGTGCAPSCSQMGAAFSVVAYSIDFNTDA